MSSIFCRWVASLFGTLLFSVTALQAGEAANPLVGPWGELVIRSIVLKPPLPFLEDFCEGTPPFEYWSFPVGGVGKLDRLLRELKVPVDMLPSLLSKTECSSEQERCVVFPSDEDLLYLPPDARRELYAYLAQRDSVGGFFYTKYFRAYRWPIELSARIQFREHFDLPPRDFENFLHLLYPEGRYYVFSDFELMCRLLSDGGVRVRFFQDIVASHALLVYLKIDASSDIDAITAYWDRGNRLKQIRPLLSSLKPKNPKEAILLDIVHLLPPYPRQKLNTFSDPGASFQPDCHHTAYNFFRADTGIEMVSADRFVQLLSKDYTMILEEDFETGKPIVPKGMKEIPKKEFGDLVLFVHSDLKVIHAANVIAGDIVFTKNGASPRRPFVLMRMDVLK
ncbi:MAG: hypothetical protein D6812_16670, partial [Deltaproteobacteria bacterium]